MGIDLNCKALIYHAKRREAESLREENEEMGEREAFSASFFGKLPPSLGPCSCLVLSALAADGV
jgi:hypothetical protein